MLYLMQQLTMLLKVLLEQRQLTLTLALMQEMLLKAFNLISGTTGVHATVVTRAKISEYKQLLIHILSHFKERVQMHQQLTLQSQVQVT